MIHLMNGNKEERVRNSEGTEVLPCGCAHTASEFIQMCDAHWREWDKLHQLAACEKLDGHW